MEPEKKTQIENGTMIELFKQLKAPLAGATAGFCTRAITQPLDCVKIRHQLQIEPIETKSGSK